MQQGDLVERLRSLGAIAEYETQPTFAEAMRKAADEIEHLRALANLTLPVDDAPPARGLVEAAKVIDTVRQYRDNAGGSASYRRACNHIIESVEVLACATLTTAPTAPVVPDREAIARLVDPDAWDDTNIAEANYPAARDRIAARQQASKLRADAILSLIAASGDGYVAVPVEPTEAMCISAAERANIPLTPKGAREFYIAMIAARPTGEQEPDRIGFYSAGDSA